MGYAASCCSPRISYFLLFCLISMIVMSFTPVLLYFAVMKGKGVQTSAALSGKDRQKFSKRQAFVKEVGH